MIDRTPLAALLLIGVIVAACGDGSTNPIAPETVSVAPGDVTIDAIGRVVQLTASARDKRGSTVISPTMYWTSSQPQVATVDEFGTVTAVNEGDAVVTAAYGEFAVANSLVFVRAAIELRAQITSLMNRLVKPRENTVLTRIVVQAREP